MKNLLRIIIMGIIIICSSLFITNNVMAGSGYTTSETLQSRIDYSLKIVWKLQSRYRTSNFNELMYRMNTRDKQIYISALQVYNKSKMEQSRQIIWNLQSKYRTNDYNILMYRMRPLDKQIYISALRDYKTAKGAYNYLTKNRW